MRQTEFQTSDLDLSAAIMAATGDPRSVFRQQGRLLVTFVFADNEVTRALIIAYATVGLIQPDKRFAACSAWLYRQARGGR